MTVTTIAMNHATTTHCPRLTEKQQWELTPQARKVFDHMRTAGSISAREAMGDHNMSSATLARRVCDLEAVGVVIERTPKEHPIHKVRYTRYSIAGNRP